MIDAIFQIHSQQEWKIREENRLLQLQIMLQMRWGKNTDNLTPTLVML